MLFLKQYTGRDAHSITEGCHDGSPCPFKNNFFNIDLIGVSGMIIFNIQYFAKEDEENIQYQDEKNENTTVENPIPITEDFDDEKDLNFETGEEVLTKQTDSSPKTFLSTMFDLLEVFAYAIAMMIIVFLFVIKFVTVDGNSMLYTLYNEERLVIYNLFYTPETNDVIVINYEDRNELLVKRVIGVEGDKIKINFDTWDIWVNDKILDQSYLKLNPEYKKVPMENGHLTDLDENNCVSFTVDEGKVFVLGDNRNHSSDSRVFGQMDINEIMGKVVFRVYPFERAGAIQ